MSAVFIKVLNQSITASYLVVAVILIRLLLKKIPKRIICILWMFVAIRLLIPFSIESAFSLIPEKEVTMEQFQSNESGENERNTDFMTAGNVTSYEGMSVAQPEIQKSASTKNGLVFGFSVVWFVGAIIMLGYSGYTYMGLRRKTAASIPEAKGIYRCDAIETPFVLGMLKPRIYLPYTVSDVDVLHIIAHEQAHIARRDHLVKPVAFLLLTIYWFNPFLWAAYLLLCKDIEFACDEKVIAKIPAAERKQYSYALLNCSVKRNQIRYCPVAFGEVGVKERIQKVVHYKKPSFWIVISAVLLCAAVSICFLTSPAAKRMEVTSQLEESVEEAILDKGRDYMDGECEAEGHQILRVTAEHNIVKVYAFCSYGQYEFQNGNFVDAYGSGVIPTVITFVLDEAGNYTLQTYREPDDGADYVSSVHKLFPLSLWSKVTYYSESVMDELKSQKEIYAKAYLQSIGRTAKVGEYQDFAYKHLSEEGVSDVVDNELVAKFGEYPYYIGNVEKVEDGQRYVYEVKWERTDVENGTVTYTKYKADTKEVVSAEVVYTKPYGAEGARFEPSGTGTVQYIESYQQVADENGNACYQTSDGRIYKYLLTLTGILPNASLSSTLVVLTDNPDITFEAVSKSMLSSNTEDFLTDTCVVGMG